MTHSGHDDETDEYELPEALRDAIVQMHQVPLDIPAEIDLSILSGARRSYQKRRRASMLATRIGVGLAAAAMIAMAVRVFVPSSAVRAPVASSAQRLPLTQAADVNHDGRVDILDAYVLARKIARHETLDPMWDLNGDGAIDQKDVDLIAGLAVQSAEARQ